MPWSGWFVFGQKERESWRKVVGLCLVKVVARALFVTYSVLQEWIKLKVWCWENANYRTKRTREHVPPFFDTPPTFPIELNGRWGSNRPFLGEKDTNKFHTYDRLILGLSKLSATHPMDKQKKQFRIWYQKSILKPIQTCRLSEKNIPFMYAKALIRYISRGAYLVIDLDICFRECTEITRCPDTYPLHVMHVM